MPSDPSTTPREIGPTPDGTALRIVWEDGAESVLAPRALRIRCPCAACVDEMTGRRTIEPASVPEGVHPLGIDLVGRYAINIRWSDGHDTGFFPFDYLRRLGEESAA